LHVRHLTLTNFRNYHSARLELPPGRLLFLGDNAQGKSNLLEAVYLLASGRSVRAGNDSETIGWASEAGLQPFTRLEAAIERRAGPVQLEAIIAGPSADLGPAAPRAGKRFRVNSIARRAVDFVGQLRAVLFTADDLEIVSGAPAGRRQFLDIALSQLDRAYYASLQRYGRLMQQRNATLRRIRDGVAGADELSLWDDGFTREGAALIAARQKAISALSRLASAAMAEISGAGETLDLAYEPQLGDEWRGLLPSDPTPDDVQRLFAAALASQRRRETAAGISLVGPHRDDLSVNLNGVSAAAFGSRAQIRTATLALRLAEAGLLRAAQDDPPVLLLDDILSEMDDRRRAAVLSGLGGFDQAWFTATSGSLLPQDFLGACTIFTVHAGAITPRRP
jgi:DNA replication and repair protein RecF